MASLSTDNVAAGTTLDLDMREFPQYLIGVSDEGMFLPQNLSPSVTPRILLREIRLPRADEKIRTGP